jgi:hypothetical protein
MVPSIAQGKGRTELQRAQDRRRHDQQRQMLFDREKVRTKELRQPIERLSTAGGPNLWSATQLQFVVGEAAKRRCASSRRCGIIQLAQQFLADVSARV